MRLYHFTSLFHLPMVQQFGLSRGDVPITPAGGTNAVWLTTDEQPSNQGWKSGSAVDKSKIRITVDIPDSDPNLHKWSDYAKREQMDPKWYDALNQTGGGGHDRWYLYEGVIMPAQFVSIEKL